MENFFASCPRGLEPLLVEDLSAAGVAHAKQIPGGVHFSADWPACYSANLHSRIATRILWQVSRGPYLKEDDIYRQALAVPWPTWFDAGQTIRVDITALKCPLRSLEFITLRIKDALCDRFRADVGKRPSVDTREPEVRIHGFLNASECTLYIDTSGAGNRASPCSTRCAAVEPFFSRQRRWRSTSRRAQAATLVFSD